MLPRMAAKKSTKKAATTFTREERAAMKERTAELKASTGERDLLAKIAEMEPADRTLAEAVHAIVKTAAPALAPRTWYGMPAYARDGEVVCFFQAAHKFKTRYATLGFSDKAHLDDGAMWPTAYALQRLDKPAITALVTRAAG
jgi:uncharacterized protein YdhG (YjbR/CyaY superfamily)